MPLSTAAGSETARATTSRTDFCEESWAIAVRQSAMNWSKSNMMQAPVSSGTRIERIIAERANVRNGHSIAKRPRIEVLGCLFGPAAISSYLAKRSALADALKTTAKVILFKPPAIFAIWPDRRTIGEHGVGAPFPTLRSLKRCMLRCENGRMTAPPRNDGMGQTRTSLRDGDVSSTG